MSEVSGKDLIAKVCQMDADSQDSLTRFFLRLLKEETWSYQLRKENLLLKKQSQEAYRKKLNKYVKLGFLLRGKRYYVEGKPRNPFRANLQVIESLVLRYSFTEWEHQSAMNTFKKLSKDSHWIASIDSKLESTSRLNFLETLFPLVFMGPEISKFFLKLLFTSVSKINTPKDKGVNGFHSHLIQMLSNVELDITHEGIDYIGKRLFLDIYVKNIMGLLYAQGAEEKHFDTLKIAILEDLTIPLIMPKRYENTHEESFQRYLGKSLPDRFDHIVGHIESVEDNFVKEYYGKDWKTELSGYVAYALISSIENPTDDIRHLLKHLRTKYGIDEGQISKIEREIEKKIDAGQNKSTLLL